MVSHGLEGYAARGRVPRTSAFVRQGVTAAASRAHGGQAGSLSRIWQESVAHAPMPMKDRYARASLSAQLPDFWKIHGIRTHWSRLLARTGMLPPEIPEG